MTDYDVVVIGAGAAGLSAGALLATEGKRVLVTDRSPVLGGRAMAVPDEGFKVNVGGHLGPREAGLGFGPGSLLGQQGRAEEGHQGPDRHAVRRARPLGRPEPPSVAAPAHRRPGRDRPVRVHHRAGVHDRELVGPLGQRQPVRAQDALLRAGHGGLLLLAGAGLGRHVGRPVRRDRLPRRRAAAGHPKPVWRRRHLVFEPSFGVIQKPGLVGMYRPHWRAPNVDGLYFASETFRSRGIGTDRAARAAVTVVEDYLGRRLATFGDGWRY